MSKKLTLGVLILCLLALGMYYLYKDYRSTTQQAVLDVPSYNVSEFGSWIWSSPLELSGKEVDVATKHKVNALYISADDYNDIYTLKSGYIKWYKNRKYFRSLDSFITKAGEKGIVVDVVAGHKALYSQEDEQKILNLIYLVSSYNKTHGNKIRALQLDVIPYTLTDYGENKEELLHNFLTLVRKSAEIGKEQDVSITVDIPHFYDDKKLSWVPEIEFNGSTDTVYNHLLKILDSRQNSRIIIMANRNFAEGPNGALDLTSIEMNTRVKGPYLTKIDIGLETESVSGEHVSFANGALSYLNSEIEKIRSAYMSKGRFAGFAIHTLSSLDELR